MSKKRSGDSGEYEFTRAAHDELHDAEMAMGVRFELSVLQTEQRGVWALSIVALANDGSDGFAYVVKWTGLWPNSMAISYGAFLYQACHRCVRMVEAWYQSRAMEERLNS